MPRAAGPRRRTQNSAGSGSDSDPAVARTDFDLGDSDPEEVTQASASVGRPQLFAGDAGDRGARLVKLWTRLLALITDHVPSDANAAQEFQDQTQQLHHARYPLDMTSTAS